MEEGEDDVVGWDLKYFQREQVLWKYDFGQQMEDKINVHPFLGILTGNESHQQPGSCHPSLLSMSFPAFLKN